MCGVDPPSPDEGETTITERLTAAVHRLRDGDAGARDELLAHACERLRALVRRQLRNFPRVRRWEDTDDVLQGVLVRLTRALEAVPVRDVRSFLGLSSEMIRRQLIDLHRHYNGPQGMGAHHATNAGDDSSVGPAGRADPPADEPDPLGLAQWNELHEQVEAMQPELKEIVNLRWYQGLTEVEVAELLGVSTKTISRRWREARIRIGALLQD